MTDPLTTWLHDEASALDIPAPPTETVLSRGRGVRRRRRTTRAVAGAVAAVVVIAGIAGLVSWRHDDQVEPARLPDRTAYEQRGAWAVGDEVHVGNHVAVVRGAEDLLYTSAGAIVFSPGSPGFGDAPGTDARATLVTPDGDVRPLHYPGLRQLEIYPPATDPSSPYIAYVRAVGRNMLEPVVVDLENGAEQAVGAPYRAKSGGTSAVRGLSGDIMPYTRNGRPTQVNWRTGEPVSVPPGMLSIGSSTGHDAYAVTSQDDSRWEIRSRTDGSVLLQVPIQGAGDYALASLSVDGHWFATQTAGGFRVYDVATGHSVTFGDDRDVSDYGWTPDGHLVGKRYPSQSSEVEVCDPATGDCVGTGVTSSHVLTLVDGAMNVA